jgi:hypothetical protein
VALFGDAGRAALWADDGVADEWGPRDGRTPGHVLGASVRMKTSIASRCTTGSIPEDIA